MSTMLNLSGRSADRLSPRIVDARLALAPGGLVFAVQLARMAPVWLTRTFWSLVDGAYFYRSYPEELSTEDAEGTADIIETLMLWHAAWLNGALDGSFLCIGDARRESVLPLNWNSDIVTCYERLTEAFAAGADGHGPLPLDPLTACGREAVALAAALTADAPIMLTVAPNGNDHPPITCSEAARTGQIEVHGPHDWNAGTGEADRTIPWQLAPLVSQLGHLGTRIVVVHTFVPNAIALTFRPPAEEVVDTDRAERAPDQRPWRGAHLFWHGLT
jgi:hypothetical protein